jgi:hypothetical protein
MNAVFFIALRSDPVSGPERRRLPRCSHGARHSARWKPLRSIHDLPGREWTAAGSVDTAGNDAGIVKNLPGKARRHFIVVVHSNLGDRYLAVDRPADQPGIYPLAYSEK